jgi:hypothetical protein|nr:MAG TPA: hypothetical protein [Caudoviricetes sp.]
MSKTLRDDFTDICNRYIERFCEKHDLCFEGWVAARVGETAEIGDMFLSFDDIRYDIDSEQKVGTIEKWWDYSSDLAMLECPKTINYRSWCKGAPLPYTQDRLNEIHQAHNDVVRAKQVLEDLLNGGDY